VGSNNLPLLRPLGQFGTRLAGGKDAASARYIYTRLSPFARLLFPAADDPVLARRVDDGAPVEPVAFLPIIPLSLVNGAAGIGTGWSTSVPPFNPLHVARAVGAALDAGWGLRSSGAPRAPHPPLPLAPWAAFAGQPALAAHVGQIDGRFWLRHAAGEWRHVGFDTRVGLVAATPEPAVDTLTLMAAADFAEGEWRLRLAQ
jgi:hypothetical protein